MAHEPRLITIHEVRTTRSGFGVSVDIRTHEAETDEPEASIPDRIVIVRDAKPID